MAPRPDQPEPGLRRLTAPNPSPMTFRGTNTYILGSGDVAVIDPGPDDPAHLAAILAALDPGERVSHIFVTHSHLDHSPLARRLRERTGAPVLAFGTHEDGRRPVMQRLAAEGTIGGGEGIDHAFAPDRRLADRESVAGDGWQIEALWTPGHIANHMCFAWNGALFTGDHVMGWASSLISPPDGDLTAFLDSCARLATREDRVFYPGHGDPVPDPTSRLAWLIDHRRERERQILDELARGPATIGTLAARIYTDTPSRLRSAAERNILAHIIDLEEKNVVSSAADQTGLVCLA
ncbi:MBL fold metallo-hydrolase [Tropicimonas sp. IMCC6043]|uniref:MBL fold metallo-hydrolase n=1 Tax=Tropicimonas sp. IMCC6043 TaxID=2510645 RepID=UPI00101C1DC3|nr:MBL fold metallo-hydrolase [Tropicimonas sp. IMCC6043]RYH09841.1 MBL fold metallo-hydrolase [Tropicimonas sp. IMCC6043]